MTTPSLYGSKLRIYHNSRKRAARKSSYSRHDGMLGFVTRAPFKSDSPYTAPCKLNNTEWGNFLLRRIWRNWYTSWIVAAPCKDRGITPSVASTTWSTSRRRNSWDFRINDSLCFPKQGALRTSEMSEVQHITDMKCYVCGYTSLLDTTCGAPFINFSEQFEKYA